MWPRDGRITIRGKIVSSAVPSSAVDWRLRLVSRERKRRRPPARTRMLNGVRALAGRDRRFPEIITVPASVDATEFEVMIRLQTLVPPDPLPRELWDLFLVPSKGEGPVLRLGRHLDDMPGKKDVVIFPQQRVGEPRRLSIRPYYTGADHLSIRCLRRDGRQ